jgi:hypothetical protein
MATALNGHALRVCPWPDRLCSARRYIDAYRFPVPTLRGYVNDIDQMASLLEELGRGSYTPELLILKDADATRDAIIKGFQEHLGRSGANDVALFYYSGHGSQEPAPKEFWHVEPDHLDETLVCYDSRDRGNWDLADKELAALIADVSRRGAHLLCVLDCCHSGSGTRAVLEEGTAVRRAPTDPRERPIDSFLLGARRAAAGAPDTAAGWAVMPAGRHILLAACRASETAKEVIAEGRSHGAFSASLISTLRQSRGAISYRDLIKRAEAQVRLRVAQQIPQPRAGAAAFHAEVRSQSRLGHRRRRHPRHRLADGSRNHCVRDPQGRRESAGLAPARPSARYRGGDEERIWDIGNALCGVDLHGRTRVTSAAPR